MISWAGGDLMLEMALKVNLQEGLSPELHSARKRELKP